MNIGFTGHRPNKLFGYDLMNKEYTILREKIKEEIEKIIKNSNDEKFVFYSGGALGFDTIAFVAVNDLKKKYDNLYNVLAIPFKTQSRLWNEKSKRTYEMMKIKADEVVYVDTIDEYKCKNARIGAYNKYKLFKRNLYIIDNSDVLIACYDGSENGGTYHCIKNFKSKKEDNEIIVINPLDIKGANNE